MKEKNRKAVNDNHGEYYMIKQCLIAIGKYESKYGGSKTSLLLSDHGCQSSFDILNLSLQSAFDLLLAIYNGLEDGLAEAMIKHVFESKTYPKSIKEEYALESYMRRSCFVEVA